jgi:tRNA G10  N-methylase Trm11
MVESKIIDDYSLRSDRLNPDIEFWVVARSEGIVLIGLRITRHRSSEKVLQKGELRPELSNLLCWLSEPSGNDVFLDPFCGYGSIPFERSNLSGYREITAADIDSKKLLYFKNKIGDKQERRNIKVRDFDFFKNSELKEGGVDKIVTDPPWGDFEELHENPIEFYRRFFAKSLFYLKEKGILVFITSRKEEIESVCKEFESNLKLSLKLDILVSGKKAGVYKLVKES